MKDGITATPVYGGLNLVALGVGVNKVRRAWGRDKRLCRLCPTVVTMRLRVHCYAGRKADERPLRFQLNKHVPKLSHSSTDLSRCRINQQTTATRTGAEDFSFRIAGDAQAIFSMLELEPAVRPHLIFMLRPTKSELDFSPPLAKVK